MFTAAIIHDWQFHADAVNLVHLIYIVLCFVLIASLTSTSVFFGILVWDFNENLEDGLCGVLRDSGPPLVIELE